MKIATWNVNSLKVRLPHIVEWLGNVRPDVLAMQETKQPTDSFPVDTFADLGYCAMASGQKTYNGVATIARTSLESPLTDIPGFEDPERRVLAATIGDVRVVNLYVPNGQRVDSEKYDYKLNWLAALRDWLVAELERHEKLVVLGDFNIAPEDRDVHDPARWRDSVLCSAPERAALRQLLARGLHDVYRHFDQPAKSFSWWDYRAGAFRRNAGLRIDLILASPALVATLAAAWIDREPRRWERPSDHTPVVAEFDL